VAVNYSLSARRSAKSKQSRNTISTRRRRFRLAVGHRPAYPSVHPVRAGGASRERRSRHGGGGSRPRRNR